MDVQRDVGRFTPSIAGYKFVSADYSPLSRRANRRWRFRVGSLCVTSEQPTLRRRGFHFATTVAEAVSAAGPLYSDCRLVRVEADAVDTVSNGKGLCSTATLHVVSEAVVVARDGSWPFLTAVVTIDGDTFRFEDGVLHHLTLPAVVHVGPRHTTHTWYLLGHPDRCDEARLPTRVTYVGSRRCHAAKVEWLGRDGTHGRGSNKKDPCVIKYRRDGTVRELHWPDGATRTRIFVLRDGVTVVTYKATGHIAFDKNGRWTSGDVPPDAVDARAVLDDTRRVLAAHRRNDDADADDTVLDA
jgi:hypothetical protein